MINGHEKFRLVDEGGSGKEFFLEVNWKGDDHCKHIRFTFPDGKQAVIKKEHLHAILFAIGNAEEQKKMIPMVERTSRHYETVIGITATKDIKKGEQIVTKIALALPTFEQEVIAEAKRELIEKGKIKTTTPIIGN
jgi:hypothetical protein